MYYIQIQNTYDATWHDFKELKRLFGVIVSTKKPSNFDLRISALASEKSSNPKTFLYNYVK
jgi:hypothetical protein